jgi:outer membrane protein assembly factor BamD
MWRLICRRWSSPRRRHSVRKSKALAAAGLLVALAWPLGGCSSLWGSDNTATIENPDPPDKMYADAEGYMSAGDFLAAAKKYEDVERNYPFSNDPSKPYARKSLALASYAYYKAGEYDDAIAAGKRYTTMHAGTEDAALAHHVVGMSYFSQMSDASRDQTATRKAMEEFRTLIRLYPNSTYAQEDDNRLRIAEDNLAAAEMTVGRYYLKRDNYLAAINRFRTVISEFQTTKHVEEAL